MVFSQPALAMLGLLGLLFSYSAVVAENLGSPPIGNHGAAELLDESSLLPIASTDALKNSNHSQEQGRSYGAFSISKGLIVKPAKTGIDRQEYPVPPVNYRPRLPPLGTYSVPGVCQSVHDERAPQVTLEDGETLQAAYKRLKAIDPKSGGIINVPWNVKINQCDNLRVGRRWIMSGGVTIRGILGPNGEQPHFYCRREERQGTIPKKHGRGKFLQFTEARGKDGAKKAANQQVVIENLHIDGYNTAISPPRSGRFIIRNNYIHHQLSNAIVMSDLDEPWQFTIEICGNEVAHAGRGNSEHGFYIHRGLHPESSVDVVLVDNLIHSTPFSSGFKSIANKHTIKGNRFYQSLDTDPNYEKQYSSMLIDVPACAENVIEGNEFHAHKPKADSFGDILIGIRNRKSIRGCDRPPYDSEKFNDPGYWASLKGEKIFRTIIRDNKFRAGSGAYDKKLYAVTAMGTFPNKPLRTFGPAVLLEPPPGWYERSRVYVSNNEYWGFAEDRLYRESPPSHCEKPKCGRAPSRKPDGDLIEVGGGERVR